MSRVYAVSSCAHPSFYRVPRSPTNHTGAASRLSGLNPRRDEITAANTFRDGPVLLHGSSTYSTMEKLLMVHKWEDFIAIGRNMSKVTSIKFSALVGLLSAGGWIVLTCLFFRKCLVSPLFFSLLLRLFRSHVIRSFMMSILQRVDNKLSLIHI